MSDSIKKTTKLDSLYDKTLKQLAGQKDLSKSSFLERLIYELVVGNIEINNFKKKDVSYYINPDLNIIFRNKKKLLDQINDEKITFKKIFYKLIEAAENDKSLINNESIYLNCRHLNEINNGNKDNKELKKELKQEEPLKVEISQDYFNKLNKFFQESNDDLALEEKFGKNELWFLKERKED